MFVQWRSEYRISLLFKWLFKILNLLSRQALMGVPKNVDWSQVFAGAFINDVTHIKPRPPPLGHYVYWTLFDVIYGCTVKFPLSCQRLVLIMWTYICNLHSVLLVFLELWYPLYEYLTLCFLYGSFKLSSRMLNFVTSIFLIFCFTHHYRKTNKFCIHLLIFFC